MKQKRDGVKVQNWHRGLAYGELSAKYFRKYDMHDEAVWDEYWNIYEACPSQRCEGNWLEELEGEYASDFLDFQHWGWIRSVGLDVERSKPLLFAVPTDSPGRNQPIDVQDGQSSIEQRLFDHFAFCRQNYNDTRAIRNYFAQSRFAFRSGSEKLFEGFPQDLRSFVFMLQPFWLRPIEQLDAKSERLAVLHHLFSRDLQSKISFFNAIRRSSLEQVKWVLWGVILGFQGNLQRASKLFGWRVPAKLQYHLESPRLGEGFCGGRGAVALEVELDPMEEELPSGKFYAMCAEVFRLGGSWLEFERLLRVRAFMLDPTDLAVEEIYYVFWAETVRWLVQNREALTDDETSSVLRWAVHEQLERRLNGNQVNFTWKKRSAAAALRSALEYERAIRGGRHDYIRWPSRNLSWSYQDGEIRWNFVELSTSTDLYEEGSSLFHCVGGYSSVCRQGHSSIVSLRNGDKRCITIQLELNSNCIVQARGAYNRPVTPLESNIIHKWLTDWVLPTRAATSSNELQ